MAEFYPARLTPVLLRLLQLVSAPIAHWRYRMDLFVDPGDLKVLRQMRSQRFLLLPNHPTFHDWIAIFLLSARLPMPLYYLAAYERFGGWSGAMLQRLGAYSVRRGLGDRASVAYTLELMRRPDCHLVIFPEGGCSFQNDTVMPFRSGPVQLAMQTLNREAKQGDPKDFYAIPISLKYRYTGNMTRVLHRTLRRLERELHLPMQPCDPQQFYARLRAIAEEVLLGIEKLYKLNSPDTIGMDWNERIPRIKNYVIQACEQQLSITPPPNSPIRERVYKMQYVLESRAEALASEDFWSYETIHRTMAGLLNFDAIYDGYVAADPTPERFLDTLVRLERAVFQIGEPVPKGHRNVIVSLGEPVNLKDYWSDYRADKTGTIDAITQKLQQSVQHRLDALQSVKLPRIRR